MIFHVRLSDHITNSALRSTSSLRSLCCLLITLHCDVCRPSSVTLGLLVRVSDIPDQCCLRSASTNRLVVPSFKLSTIGSRTFKVAFAETWNGLKEDVTSSLTLLIFRKRLKTCLFHQSYTDIVP